MRPLAASTALLALLLCACPSRLDMTQIKVGPDNTVSWEDAKTIIKDGDAESVFQSHAGDVSITLEDGTRYKTTQPQVDAVIDWVKTCGKTDSIAIMTE
jgi:hypothetical protein